MASRRVTRGATQSIADRWSLPLSARLEEGLRRLGASRPLPIQAASCARVFAGESVAIHSQTGTGKTLAYLLPLVARLRPAAPRQILTVVPSYELGRQTLEFAHDLAGARTAALLPPAKSPAHRAEQLLEQPEPLLIVTGAQLGALLPALEDEGGAALRALRATLMAVVLDEPDAILRVPTYSTMTRRRRPQPRDERQQVRERLARARLRVDRDALAGEDAPARRRLDRQRVRRAEAAEALLEASGEREAPSIGDLRTHDAARGDRKTQHTADF